MDIVINYDSEKRVYKIYEGTTETLLISQDLGEGMFNLNQFLVQEGYIPSGSDILKEQNLTYHFDSTTLNALIQNNLSLLARIRQGPSEFKISSEKFGSSAGAANGYKKKSDFSRGSKNFGKSTFSGKSNFSDSNKKWMK